MLSHMAQLVARLTQEPEVQVQYPVRPHTFVSCSADSRRAVVSYWRKYVHEVLVNHLGGLSLTRESVVRLTDFLDMTIVDNNKTNRQKQRKKNHNSSQNCITFMLFSYLSRF